MNHVTDYDCWRPHEEDVTVEKVIKTLMGNVDAARQAIRYAVKELSQNKDLKSESWNKLKDALFTRPELVPKKTRSDLALLTDKYWGQTAKKD